MGFGQALVEGLRSCVWVPLPEGWVEHFDRMTSRPYYVNPDTKDKQWERPVFACARVSRVMLAPAVVPSAWFTVVWK